METGEIYAVAHRFREQLLRQEREASLELVRRYGEIIGFATREIRAGEHVHMHNLGVQGFDRCWAFGTKVYPVALVPAAERRTFLGYARAARKLRQTRSGVSGMSRCLTP